MNYNSIRRQYFRIIYKIKSTIERKLLVEIKDINVNTESIYISYNNRIVSHTENEFGMIYCDAVYEDGKLKYVDGTDNLFIDTTFQNGAQEELQLLAKNVKALSRISDGYQKVKR